MTAFLAQAPAAPAGPPTLDTLWRLESSWRYAPWVTVVALAVIVAVVVYCYAKEVSPAGRAYRGMLAGLRLVTVGLLLVMLSEVLMSGTRSGRPRFAVIVDTSGSMGVEDTYDESALPESLRAVAADGATRLDLAEAALSPEAIDLMGRLTPGYDVEVFLASDQLARVEPPKDDEGQLALTISETASATRLGDAIQTVLSGPDGAPQGLLVLSDGRVTEGPPLAAAAETARRVAAPLYLVGIGSSDSPPDVELADLLAEEVVFVDDLVNFRATLRVSSAVRSPVRVTLRRSGDDQILAEQVIEPLAGGGAAPVQLIHRPDQPGTYRYTLTASEADGELNTSNNEIRHELSVRDQKVRVLVASSGPSYEFRYLKHLLERDETVDVDTFLQEADLDYASADPSAIIRLPLREAELDGYDVVVVMDLDPRLAPRTFWPALRGFVGERGGGLALVAGARYLPDAYRGVSDFAALYPAELDSQGVGDTIVDEGFRVSATPFGLGDAAMQLADDRPSTELTWRQLPELYWRVEAGKLKPAARVLAAHPTALSADGAPAPLIVSQYYGSGRVVLHAVDSTYRWRRRQGDVYFARYWVQLLRSLARGRLSAGQGESELTVDRQRYKPGEPVRLRLRRGATQPGEEVAVLLLPEDGPQRRVALTPAADQPGFFEAMLNRLPTGAYRVLPAGGSGAETDGTTFEVVPPPGEFAELSVDAGAMRAAAERSRGKFCLLAGVEDLLESLPQARRVPQETLPPIELWNRWWMLAAICSCLTCEWILRKRRAML